MCWANYVHHRVTLIAPLNLGFPPTPQKNLIKFSKLIETFDTAPYRAIFLHNHCPGVNNSFFVQLERKNPFSLHDNLTDLSMCMEIMCSEMFHEIVQSNAISVRMKLKRLVCRMHAQDI